MNKAVYKELSQLIEKETGIVYLEADYDRLLFRVQKLKELLKVNTDEELLRLFKSSQQSELQSLLISTSTNNETSFFRDRKPFEILINLINSKIKNETKDIRIWSIPSSTGQEPYSICMKLKEIPDFENYRFRILASDIDNEVLTKAKLGQYSLSEIQRGLPILYLTKYFNQIDTNCWEVKSEIKNMIDFGNFNLINGLFPEKEFNVIFCRNVLIYLSMENKSKVVNSLFNSLKPGGYLFLGGAENLIGVKSGFKLINIDDFVVYQKES